MCAVRILKPSIVFSLSLFTLTIAKDGGDRVFGFQSSGGSVSQYTDDGYDDIYHTGDDYDNDIVFTQYDDHVHQSMEYPSGKGNGTSKSKGEGGEAEGKGKGMKKKAGKGEGKGMMMKSGKGKGMKTVKREKKTVRGKGMHHR